MSALYATWPVLRAAAGGAWREHPARLALAILGIACGVALGVAVHLINSNAVNEFNLAAAALVGEADLVVRGPRSGFPQSAYPRIARLPGVRALSPAMEIEAQITGRRDTLKVVGLDPFRAAHVQPHLLADNHPHILELFKTDSILLSRAAADQLGLKAGDELRLQSGTRTIRLRIVEILAAGATREPMAVMDIANAQWHFDRLEELHRLDIRLEPSTDVSVFRKNLAAELPPGTVVATPDAEASRSASLSRAYRTNLDMLALVALLTGAFLVFSTQFLALMRRRPQLALLRVLGVTRAHLSFLLVLEGAVVGVVGSAIGVAAGCVLARIGTEQLGGDLGAGYFSSVTPALHIDAGALLVFFVLGVVCAAGGAALPALEAARRAPALAIKAGDEEDALQRLRRVWPGLLLVGSGLLLSQLPSHAELPIAGYASIALILVGGILAMPRFAELVFARLPASRYPPAGLAAAQLQATPRQVAISLAAILASFSLMVSMLIMVGSFRDSLEAWLDQMLPADLYVRAARAGQSAYFTPAEQAKITALPGVSEALFVRSQNMYLRADRPAVTLLARALPPGRQHPPLPFEGATHPTSAQDPPPAWLSEVAADLLQVKPGARVELPIANGLHAFTVAGIWRDYARQNGAVLIDRAQYIALSADPRANEAALHLQHNVSIAEMSQRLRAAFPDADALEIAATRELKSISLSIFDRTFAVTYALEGAAILIGLFGVSAGFSAQALARRREFGVLRHIGMTRGQIAAMLACEGFVVGSLGVVAGLVLGWVVSLILIHVVNRQSFHWSMDLHMPWGALACLAGSLIAAASITAVLSGHRAMSSEVTRAVREDW